MSQPNRYDIGNQIQLTATFTQVSNGSLVNPTTVTIQILDPSGVTTSPTVSNPSTGIYTVLFTTTIPGRHAWKAKGTGTVIASGPGEFIVNTPDIP